MNLLCLIILLFNMSVIAQQVKFPFLALGNEYQYSLYTNDGYQTIKIEKDSVFQNGYQYLSFPIEFLNSPSMIRTDSSGRMWSAPYQDTANADELLFYYPEVKKGDKWIIYEDKNNPDLSLYGLCVFDSTAYILGKIRNSKIIEIINNYETRSYFGVIEEIGVYCFGDFIDGGEFIINYAKVNDSIYGNYFDPENLNFFPIKLGNEYQFKESGTNNYIFGKIEKDSIFPNNQRYFLMPENIFKFGNVRVDEYGNVFSISQPFIRVNDSDTLEYEIFFAKSRRNDPWQIINTNVNADLKGETITMLESYRDIIRRTKYVCIYDNNETYFNYILVEGIGLVSFQEKGKSKWNLNYAKVNDIVYGELVTVKNEYKSQPQYYLSQNYPNPFNPKTYFNFMIPNDGHVIFKIHDLLGRELFTLIDEYKERGNYEISFDGSSLSSGIYLYTLKYDNKNLTKKMMIIK